ncbi:MAG: signal peptide peptidase SppA [Coriobacteriales bacterium]|nr:signal peptide peptidase SppA [Coriobacteriales bacterium]
MYDEGQAPDAPQPAPTPRSPAPPVGEPAASAQSGAEAPPFAGGYGYPPYPPYPPQGAYPPYAAYPPPQPEPTPRKKRWWIWLLVLGILFLCVIVSCAPFVWLASLPDGGGDPFAGIGDGAVAVIPIDGTIQGVGGTEVVTPANFLRQLKRAEDDSRVKAIVLRVDSGGGTVAASEEIATYVKNAKKPVVVSVGDICASGAYMISSQADEIYAVEGSDVGSIGVILMIPNVEGLLDKLGISVNTITAGKNKDVGSPFRELTPNERKRLKGQVDEVYEQFIRIVAEGRKMPTSEVRKLATGWVWTGVEAKKLGLIDEIGTYQDAVNAAGKLGKVEGEPEVITYQEPFEELFGELGGIASQISPYSKAVPQPQESVPR